ncbi:MAG: hypothetical protein KGJ55_01350 [Gammaproteobacteria bacterium]|nr:hypothetical protein [Gammaproteobacteria bacterium]
MLRFWIPVFLTCAMLVACSSTRSRIRENQALFDSYPPEVQQQIRAGRAMIGFTPDQVRMALGKTDHIYEHTDRTGTSEIWDYTDSHGLVGLSLGVGGFSGGSTAVGGGIGVSSVSGGNPDKLRVVFRDGRVASVERPTPGRGD